MKKILISISILAISICIYCFIKVNKEDETIIDLENIKESVDVEAIDYDNFPKETIESSSNVNITKAGVYTLTGTIEGGVTIDTKDDVKLILDNVTITNNGPCILIKNSNSTTIYLNENTTNYLTDNTYDNTEYNATIYSKDDLVFDGTGKLVVNANYEDAIATTDNLKIINGNYEINSIDEAIRGNDSIYILNGSFNITSKSDGIKTNNETDDTKGNIVIENGVFNINSENDAIQSINNLYIQNGEFNIKTGGGSTNSSTTNNWGHWGFNNTTSIDVSAKGIKATNNIVIENGTYIFNTSDDSVHSNNNVNIKEGTYKISSGDDGIHADTDLIIDGGTIDITKSYEGIEASNITINNGTISLVASDDGINISGGNDQSSMSRPGAGNFSSGNGILTINNGIIKINSKGDGIDINGTGYINGGTIYVEGPTDSGNGFFDYDKNLKITNATVIASGSVGMLQTPTTSDMNAIMIYMDSSSNIDKNIVIKENDKEILTYSSSKTYSGVYIASPLLKNGDTYDIYLDDELLETVNISNSLTIIGNSNNSMMGPGMMQPGRR